MVLLSKFRPVVLNGEDAASLQILRSYADFWKIPYQLDYQGADGALMFTSSRKVAFMEKNNLVILSLAGREEFEKAASDFGVNVSHNQRLLSLPVGPEATVSIAAEVHEFTGSKVEPVLTSGKTIVLSRVKGTSLHLFSLDIVTAYQGLLYGGFEPNPSRRFKTVSRLPLSYKLVPSFLRNRAFRSPNGLAEVTEQNLGPVEYLRTLFLASIVSVSGPVPRIAFWRRGKAYALAVTHDVETETGLTEGASRLLEVEHGLGIKSTWNIPTERYHLKADAVNRLTEAGEIGTHDTKHDGRLVLLDEKKIVSRLTSCKSQLEELSGQRVRGFRAPLLQHSMSMLKALGSAGYEFDSSCPSWEILSPTSLRPHGVGTVFPFNVGDIIEIPVSLPQDHQLIRVAGQKPSETVDLLIQLSRWVRNLGGACVLLIHPDYEFGAPENEMEYQRLLENFESDPLCDIMTLGKLADWWRYRARARWEISDNNLTMVSSDSDRTSTQLRSELVTGYGSQGFTSEPLHS